MAGYIGSTAVSLSTTAANVEGNITVTGNVDGRDVSVDGTKLDTIPVISTSSVPSFTAKSDGTTDGHIQLNCTQNTHGIKLKSPPHSASASYTLVFPTTAGNSGQFLRTDGSGVLSWGTDATLDNTKLPLAGGAMTGAITTNSTFDGRDVAADGVTADAALPKAGGAMTGAITTNSTFDGRDVAADGVLATNALPKAGGAMTGAITTNSTFDGVDIATRDAVLTSTTTTANAALPKAGGAMTDDITFGAGGEVQFGNSGEMGLFSSSGTSQIRINSGIFKIRADDMRFTAQNGSTEFMRVNSTGVTITGAAGISGQSTVAGGAASAPSYSFTGDPDTGISRPTSNAVNIVTAGTERVRVDSSGRVGIGGAPNTSWRNDISNQKVLMLGTEATLFADGGVTTQLVNNAFINNSDTFLNISTRGASQYQQYQGIHKWFTAGSANAGSNINTEFTAQKMTLAAGGDLTLAVGNLVIGTAGKGIDFSAQTRSSASGVGNYAEILDHYEEGSWTPAANNGTFGGVVQGRYTRVGNKVTAWCDIQSINDTTTDSALDINGLPFAPVGSGTLGDLPGSIMTRYLDVGVTEEMGVVSFISSSATAIRIYVMQTGGTYTRVKNSHYSNVAIGIRLTITYMVA